jgi:hypothetical protein
MRLFLLVFDTFGAFFFFFFSLAGCVLVCFEFLAIGTYLLFIFLTSQALLTPIESGPANAPAMLTRLQPHGRWLLVALTMLSRCHALSLVATWDLAHLLSNLARIIHREISHIGTGAATAEHSQ